MPSAPLKIELQKISYNASLSQETSAYSATLLIDGKKVGTVSNHGHGGADDFTPARGFTYQTYLEADKRIQTEYPKVKLDTGAGIIEIEASLETVCGEILETFLVSRDIRRLMSKNVLFFEHGRPPEGETRPLMRLASKSHPLDLCIKHIKTKHPEALVLNDVSLELAIQLYRAAA